MRQTGPASTPTSQCTHGARPPARLRCERLSEMDRSWRHSNRSSKKKASPAPRTSYGVQAGRAPGIVVVMASAEAGEDTALPAAGCRQRALWPWPTSQPRSSQRLLPCMMMLHPCLPAAPAPIQGLLMRACRPPARHQQPAGLPASALT